MSRNKVNELKRKVLRDLKAHILSALMVNADFLLPLPPFLSLSFVITVHVSCVEEPMIIRLQKWTKDHQKRAFNYNYKGLSIGVSRVPHVRKNLLPLVGNKETRLSTLHARWRQRASSLGQMYAGCPRNKDVACMASYVPRSVLQGGGGNGGSFKELLIVV